jgi:serine protease inhibitor
MNVTFRGSGVVLGLLFLTGCEAPTDAPIRELPRQLTASEQSLIRASNGFAFGLVRGVAQADAGKNVFLSPLSASMALGMTLNGAVGQTFDEMRATLGYQGLTQDEINASYRSLIDLLHRLDPRVQMLVANSIWYSQGFPFESAFLQRTRTHFDAEVRGVNFADPATVGAVNSWVKNKTSGRIPTILKQVDPLDVMYLINAIYFKGTWTKQFDRSRTQNAAFYDARGQTRTGTVRMMHHDGPVAHFRGGDFEAIDLPYGGGAFSLTVLLPERGVSVNDLLGTLDQARWDQIVGGFSEAGLEVYLPKFRLEYEKSLVSTLEALGMVVAFQPGRADFTGMSPLGRELYISEVLQKTFVEVNEEGTEAAAVTSVTMRVTSAPPSFRADRPFVLAIRERHSGTILFAGVINQPW